MVAITGKVITGLTIPASSAVFAACTSAVAIGNGRGLTFYLPSITSAQAFLALSPTINSADFCRIVNSAAQIGFAVAAGPAAVDASPHIAGANYARIELSVGQASVRSLSAVLKN
jgi:hypothetical protein